MKSYSSTTECSLHLEIQLIKQSLLMSFDYPECLSTFINFYSQFDRY